MPTWQTRDIFPPQKNYPLRNLGSNHKMLLNLERISAYAMVEVPGSVLYPWKNYQAQGSHGTKYKQETMNISHCLFDREGLTTQAEIHKLSTTIKHECRNEGVNKKKKPSKPETVFCDTPGTQQFNECSTKHPYFANFPVDSLPGNSCDSCRPSFVKFGFEFFEDFSLWGLQSTPHSTSAETFTK